MVKFSVGRTASGNVKLILRGECEWQEFPGRARWVVERFGMRVERQVDAFDVRMWIVEVGGFRFCVSWDEWCREVTVMGWEGTPDEAVEGLLEREGGGGQGRGGGGWWSAFIAAVKTVRAKAYPKNQ